jgi:hypothetical protein
MQTELPIESQADADKELNEKLWLIYRQYDGKLAPFFELLKKNKKAMEQLPSPDYPNSASLTACVKTK